MAPLLAVLSVLGALVTPPTPPASRLEGSAATTSLQPAASRVALRDRVISSLPTAGAAPLFLDGELRAAVEELEGLEFVPATAEFLRAGTTGSWHVCAFSEPEHRSSIEAFEMRVAGVDVVRVEQVVAADGSTRTSASFRVDGDGSTLDGLYEVEGTLSLTPMIDSLDMRTSAERRLRLPALPASMDVPQMMQTLHARLCTEFRAEDGVRVGQQTTYLDDRLRITRCTTRELRGACTVYLRRDAS